MRREHPFAFSLGPERAADHRRDRSARPRGRRRLPGARLQERPRRRRTRTWLRWSSASTASSGCSTRSPSCATAPPRSRSSTGSWSVPEEWVGARYTAAERPTLEERLAARVRRARERGFAVSPRPASRPVPHLPGRAGLCSWGEAETLREDPQEQAPQRAQEKPRRSIGGFCRPEIRARGWFCGPLRCYAFWLRLRCPPARATRGMHRPKGALP